MYLLITSVIIMKSHLLITLASLVLLFFPLTCYGDVLFSTLPQTLVVTASPAGDEVLKGGEDIINITWGMSQSFAESTDVSYREVKLKLCYAPISQHDRNWRKPSDNLSKDKTCQFTIARRNYTRNNQTFVGTIATDVPTAFYFVRVYAYNSTGSEVAYGQTTDANHFKVQSISGRRWSIDVASICLSAFALLSAVGFFFLETAK